MCKYIHTCTRGGLQSWSWSCEQPDTGTRNQTPVSSSTRRTRPLNCGATSLVNFILTISPSLLFLSITMLPRLVSSSWAYRTSGLSFWSGTMPIPVHCSLFSEQKLKEIEGPHVTQLVSGGNKGLNPWAEWRPCPSQFSALHFSLLKVHKSPSRPPVIHCIVMSTLRAFQVDVYLLKWTRPRPTDCASWHEPGRAH